MNQNISTQNDMTIFVCIMTLLFLTGIGIYLYKIAPFLAERRYIKMEIGRSFDEKRYQFWKNRLKRLYLSSIPVIGRFFR